MNEVVPAELAEALPPVLRDLETVALVPRIEASDWAGGDQVTAMSWWPGGSGTGIYVMPEDRLAERIAMLADQMQTPAVEVLPWLGRPAVWPECPDHPDSHPLEARVSHDVAVWVCTRSEREIAKIGEVAAALEETGTA